MINYNTRAKAYFQYAIVRCDLKQGAYPGATLRVCARHDVAAQPAQEASRATAHAHKNCFQNAHRWCVLDDQFAAVFDGFAARERVPRNGVPKSHVMSALG